VVSQTGTQVTAVALPWFVLATTGSPGRMALVMAAEFGGILVFGIPGGGLASRLGARQTMLASDLARGPLIALVPVLHWAHALSLPLLLVIVFAVGSFFPAYQASQQLVLTGLVGEDEARLTRASGLFGAVNEGATLVGPGLAGVLIGLLGPVPVLLIDAGSYVAAFAIVFSLVPACDIGAPVHEARSLDGVRFIVRDPVMRRLVVSVSMMELSWTALFATLPVLAFTRFSRSARLAGWFLASYGGGSVVGGLLAGRIRSGRPLRSTSVATVLVASAMWALVSEPPAWGVAVLVAMVGVFTGLLWPSLMTELTLRPQPELRPRVLTAATTAFSVTGPIGFIGAGVLLQHVHSTRPAFVMIGAIATVATLLMLRAVSTGTGAVRVAERPSGSDRFR
jgi:MFS family permease